MKQSWTKKAVLMAVYPYCPALYRSFFYIAKTAKHRHGERFHSDQGKKRKDARKVSGAFLTLIRAKQAVLRLVYF